MDNLNFLENLIKEGNMVLKTSYTPYMGSVMVNIEKFTRWQSKCIFFLENMLGPNHKLFINFENNVDSNKANNVKMGIGILNSLIELINDDVELINNQKKDNFENYKNIEIILNNFHRVARQLRIRREDRPTLEINDEYDVQDLLYSLLLIHFDDVRPEESTPSYAGGSSRMDFLINDINVVIETKMARENLKDKQIGDELIIDCDRYVVHPSCEVLYCFIYDPKGFIKNPYGLEKDLSGMKNDLDVKVIVVPKF